MNFNVIRFDSIPSTNIEALEQAKSGANEGLCVVAEQQTAGRGRHGRTWISEKNAGLYSSIVLRPRIENKFFPLLTLMSAVAVCDVLKDFYNLQPDIKWANDVLINERKICGVLAEMTETKIGAAIVVGIGINLTNANFPAEIAEIATSIEQETNQKTDAKILLDALLEKFGEYYEIFQSDDGAERIRREWARRSSYFEGKTVRVKFAAEIVSGTTCGIEPNGALRVRTANGEIKILHAGDVENVRPADAA